MSQIPSNPNPVSKKFGRNPATSKKMPMAALLESQSGSVSKMCHLESINQQGQALSSEDAKRCQASIPA